MFRVWTYISLTTCTSWVYCTWASIQQNASPNAKIWASLFILSSLKIPCSFNPFNNFTINDSILQMRWVKLRINNSLNVTQFSKQWSRNSNSGYMNSEIKILPIHYTVYFIHLITCSSNSSDSTATTTTLTSLTRKTVTAIKTTAIYWVLTMFQSVY